MEKQPLRVSEAAGVPMEDPPRRHPRHAISAI
jgi:hypothetical protein